MARFTVESKYLSHSDISDEKDTPLTITGYDRITVGQGAKAEEKWLLTFRESRKGLVLNKTNGKTLTKALRTDDMDQWVGRKVALYVKDDVEFNGEIMSAIRIRLKLPKEEAFVEQYAGDEMPNE